MLYLLKIRGPQRSTQSGSSAASDVYRGQVRQRRDARAVLVLHPAAGVVCRGDELRVGGGALPYTLLRAHETVLDPVCRLLLEKKNISSTT